MQIVIKRVCIYFSFFFRKKNAMWRCLTYFLFYKKKHIFLFFFLKKEVKSSLNCNKMYLSI